MEVRILGPLEVAVGGQVLRLGGGKQRALLALLALERGRTVSVSRIVADLWGDDPPETASKMVQIAVSALRKALPEEMLETRPPGYRLNGAREDVDAMRCEALLRSGRDALASDPAAAAALLDEAVRLWRGPALAEFSEPFAGSEVPRLEELHLACLEERAEAELACGRGAGLVGELEALVARHPLRERLRGQLMRALYAAGRQADALAVYRAARALLDEELGIEPSAALRELERRILRQDMEPPPLAAAPGIAAGSTAPPQPVPARPLVGREGELARLQALLAEAAAGRPRVVLVAGEAGAGKTRLVDAALAGAGVRVTRGQCVEQHGRSEAYMPVLQALDALCRGPAGAEAVRALAERAPTWLMQLPWLVPAGHLERLQAPVFGATADRMLREGVETLLALAETVPLVLVLEDLHWADPSTVDLLAGIARREDRRRLLVIATFRPQDAAAAGHRVGRVAEQLATRGLAEWIDLRALGAEAVAHYLALRLPGLDVDAALPASLAERTAGHPLFLEKVVDAWIDDGKVERRGSDWRVAVEADELVRALPTGVRQLIRHRLMALAPDDRRLLEAASVAGAEFAVPLVAAACRLDLDAAEERCEELARGPAVLVAAGLTAWPDGTVAGRYAFAHELWHEVLYDDLPPGRRARLHVAVGDRLERAYGARAGEVAGELAAHFVRGKDDRRAVRYLRLAASAVLERRASREAVELLSRALGLVGGIADPGERDRVELDLQFLYGPALISTLGWSAPGAEQAIVRASELAERLGRPAEHARSVFRLATLYEVQGHYERSEALLSEEVARAARPRGAQPLIDAYEVLACSFLHQGVFDQALQAAERGLAEGGGDWQDATYAAYGDNPGLGCHAWAALALWFLGQPDRARARARHALELAEQADRRHGLATALTLAAVLAACMRDYEEARVLSERAIEVSAADGLPYRLGMSLVVRGWAAVLQGGGDEGFARLQQGIEIARATGARMDDAHFLAFRADAERHTGRAADALDTLAEARAIVPRGGRFFYEAELHRLEGEVRHAAGDEAAAEAALRRALAVATEQRSPALVLRAAVSLGVLLHARGADEEARVLLVPAYGALREGFDTADLRAAAELLDRLGTDGSADRRASRANAGHGAAP